MSALSNVHASTLLNTSLRSGTYYLALFLTDPTASGTGTEVSGGGYARKIINFSAPSLVSGKEQVSNSAPVDFGTLTADLGTVAYWGIYDALTAGNLLWYGSFTRSKNAIELNRAFRAGIKDYFPQTRQTQEELQQRGIANCILSNALPVLAGDNKAAAISWRSKTSA